MFKKALFVIIALSMLLLSVLAARAYTVDLTSYPLVVQDMTLTGENQISFKLFNPSPVAFNMKTLKSFEAVFQKTKTSSQFVHYTGDAFTAIGNIPSGYALQYNIPFDRQGTSDTKLKCKEPIDIKIYLTNGEVIAHWTGIPKCEIEGKRPCGLLKVDETVAEFYDEEASLLILWELVDADPAAGKVLLMKSQGRQDPMMAWVSTGQCMDLESGKCMTDILDILFTEAGVTVTLKDNRHDRLATLSKTFTPLYHAQTTQQVPTQTTHDPQVTRQAPVQTEQVRQMQTVGYSAESQTMCASGCMLNGVCYQEGDRQYYLGHYSYCDRGWKIQRSEDFFCTEDYECQTNKCIDNRCTIVTATQELDSSTTGQEPQTQEQRQGMITRLLLWIDDLL